MNIKSLFIICAATAVSATGCYAEVGDPTEDSEVAVVDENEENAADESLALTDDEENTGESEEALSTWHGRGLRAWGRGYARGIGRGLYGRGLYGRGLYGAGCFDPCYDPCYVDPCDPCGGYGGYGGYGAFW